jgi:hypothetical protein
MDQAALLEDLDQRQNAVLEQLAELNASVEALLKECLSTREQASEAVQADPPKKQKGRQSLLAVEMPGLADRAQQPQSDQNTDRAPGGAQDR